MAIANPWLLIFGGLFVAIPIVLHLVMQRRPKHLIFPALRFVKQRRETNRRRLQLRHWLLLLLRCLAILIVAAALARPSVASQLVGSWAVIGLVGALLVAVLLLTAIAWVEKKGRLLVGLLAAIDGILGTCLLWLLWSTWIQGSAIDLGHREEPVAAVLVIDTSPRMEYRQANQTRLDQARRIARWLVRQMPRGSQVSVVDARPGEPFFSADIAAAEKRIDVLQTTYVNQPLVTTLEKAIRVARESEKRRKEVYVLTDMTEAAWRGDAGGSLRRRLEQANHVTLYVIDVGTRDPENFALGQIRLAKESIPKHGELLLLTELKRLGSADARTVELHLEKPDLSKPTMLDGQLQLPEDKWTRTVTTQVDANSAQQIEFRLGGLELGVHQGMIKIVGEDSLAVDNQRYFTVEVRDAWPILVVEPAGGTAKFLTEALAPYQQRQTGEARYQCTVTSHNNLLNEPIADFAAVALLDPEPMTPLVWEKLESYVAAGGGLAVFLGHNAQADESFNSEPPQRLLAGRLDPLIGRSTGDLYLATPRTFEHPVTSEFRAIASSVPWREFPIYRHWVLQGETKGSVVFRFGNHRPAIVDRRVGKGHCLTMTTPVSDPARPTGRHRWNDLPLGNAWPYVILIDQIFAYLVESGGGKLNYLVGQTAVLPNEEQRFPTKYDLFLPSGQPQQVPSHDDRVVITSTKTPGAYRLRGSRGGPVVRGFCANLPEEESELARMGTERLDELLGAQRYKLATSREEIHRGQGEAREGRQFYPQLVLALVVLLAVEQLLANRFYQKEE